MILLFKRIKNFRTMAFCFDENKVINAVLFLLQCMGGKARIERVYALLYLSDIAHLVKHGTLITGDVYIAMKTGPVPLHTMGLYRRLREGPLTRMAGGKIRPLISICEDRYVSAHTSCDVVTLAESEVASLFDVVHNYKEENMERLLDRLRSRAWQHAGYDGELSLAYMAEENGATPEMIKYIETSFEDEVYCFSKQTSEYAKGGTKQL